VKRLGILAMIAFVTGCCAPPRAVEEPIARAEPEPEPPQPQPQPQPEPQPQPLPVPPVVAMEWEQAGIDWAKPVPTWPEKAFVPPVPVVFKVGGVRVFLVENHRLPLVSMRVLHLAGGVREDGAKSGLAALTADLLDEGTATRTALELPEELERLGARLNLSAGVDHATLSLDTLAETLEPSLEIAAGVVMKPRFDPADFERIKSERLADLALRPDSPRAIAAIVFEQIVFEGHPYATPGAGWIETVEALTLDDVRTFWSTHYAPGATALVVAGDVTRAQLEPMLARTFGTWKGAVKVAPAPKRPRPVKPVLAVVDRPGAPQTVVTMGRLGPDARDPQRAALDVANTAVGGSFAARLNARLREQLGYTYGIFSTVFRGQQAGAWSVSSSIRTDVTGAGIKEVLAILAATSSAPMPADELARSKALIVLGLPGDFETNGAIAGAYAALIADGRPIATYRTLPGQIAKVTAAGARKVAAAQWKDLAIVVVGDWALIGKELEALGLPIARYDAHGQRLPPAPAP
jgi:zinc protease